MGANASIYAAGDVSDEELARAEAVVRRLDRGFGEPNEYTGNYLDRIVDPPRVQYRTLDRFFSPARPNRDWPSIYAAIRIMQAAFPDRTIHYGSDEDDFDFGGSPIATPLMIETNWAAWLAKGGN